MKKFKDISEFEDLLKDQLQGHASPTPPDVWSSIASSTAQSVSVLSQATTFLSSATNLLKVALFAGGIATVGVVTYNETTKPTVEEITPSITEGNSPTEVPSETTTKPVESILQENPSTSNPTAAAIPQQAVDNVSESKHTKPPIRNAQANTPAVSQTKPTSPHIQPTDNLGSTPTNTSGDQTNGLALQASNTKPCLGETVQLNATQATIWYVGGNALNTKPQKTINYSCTQAGSVTIHAGSTTLILTIRDTKSGILTQKENESQYYTANLIDQNQLANWYIDDKLVATNTSSIREKIDQVGTHTLKAEIVNQKCVSNATTTITISPVGEIKIWNIFTPNGDGKNDTYKVDITEYENFSMQIVDARNKLLFFSADPKNGWNGTVENLGNPCVSGYYIAKISYTLKGEKPVTKNIRFKLQRT